MIRRQLVSEKRGGLTMKELVERYGEKKGKQVAEAAKAKSLWYYDPNLPGDAEFIHYPITRVSHSRHSNVV